MEERGAKRERLRKERWGERREVKKGERLRKERG
jgi:hypothetical protein